MAEGKLQDRVHFGPAALAVPVLALVAIVFVPDAIRTAGGAEPGAAGEAGKDQEMGAPEGAMKIHYLEIVSPDVDAICKTYANLHGVEFGAPDASLGNARTAKLPGGGLLGVRAPLRADEEPIVRQYLLVEDLEAAVSQAADSGAKIALPPMALPGRGKCAIFIQGGAEHGLWQLERGSE